MGNFENLTTELKNKCILITGGSGFFGKNLCSALVTLNISKKLGMKIYALARTDVSLEGVQFIRHDVTQPFNFQGPIDFIIHAATPVISEENNIDMIMDIIVNGTQHTLNFAERINCSKFLLVSSGAVYGEQPEDLKKIPEDYTIKESFYNFKSAYSTGKRISELLALDWSKRTGKHLTIARCFAFSGKFLPIDQHLAIGNFVRDAIKEHVINVKGDGCAIRSYLDAEDLVIWLLTILIKGESGEAYNVGSDQEITIKELALKIAEKVPGTHVVIQDNESSKKKRNRYIPSIEKAKFKLKLEVKINLGSSIQKMIDFNKGLI
ncbi:MAG: NAD(P)-dependent oxidoreductase [Bacteriovorax sp.]|nr:NAD(P)-dependent oxidoreductase [Bacteriovorax sp.]